MAGEARSRERYSEAFWRTHHEAWRQSDLNQREYCEAQGLSLKAFGNWRAKFKAEPQPLPRKLLYRRGELSHRLSHRLSHTLSHSVSHMTNGSAELTLVVPPARDGHRRSFSEADRGSLRADSAMARSWQMMAVLHCLSVVSALPRLVQVSQRFGSSVSADRYDQTASM